MAILLFQKTLTKHTVNEREQGLGVHKGKAQAKWSEKQLQKLWSAARQKAPLSLLLQIQTNEALLKKFPRVTESQNVQGWKGPLWVI